MKQKTHLLRLGSRPVLTRTIAPPLLAGLGLLALFPTTGEAATAVGGTTTTMSLKYSTAGTAQWVMRVDPPSDVKSFQ